MFHTLSDAVLARMQYLEQIDVEDRKDGTPRLQRLRQIAPETGKFLALLAANTPEGDILEVGTSAGYSTLWLAMSCTMQGRHITTFEILPEKIRLARETFRLAEVGATVELKEGDARQYLSQYERIAFCFLDAEKEVYEDCYDLIIPRLVRGGLLVADNAISHQEELGPMLDKALADQRVDALVVPIGRGELVCRKM
jgi:caffeoyl-CoA O-methyltransferase